MSVTHATPYTGNLISGLIETVEKAEVQAHKHRCTGCGAALECPDGCELSPASRLVCGDCDREVRR